MQLKNLFVRSLSGLVYSAVILLGILWGPMVLGFILLIFSILSLLEIKNLFPVTVREASSPALLAIGTGIAVLLYLHTIDYLPAAYLSVVFALLFLLFVKEIFRKRDNILLLVSSQIFAIVYIVFPLGIINRFFFFGLHPDIPARSILLAFFVFIWINDTFAYLTGILIGKHKLAPQISPKKTIEGSAGGLFFTLVAGYLFSLFFAELQLYQWLILAFLIVVTGSLGDLFESMLKRNAGIKDSGNLIPGHGGILDRLDSVLIAAPFIYLYLNLIK